MLMQTVSTGCNFVGSGCIPSLQNWNAVCGVGMLALDASRAYWM